MKKNIRLLPEHLINQIKAGEVVESPSTLLKELIENSLDAGSTRIEIDIAENLTDYIVIKDNGHGMTKDELPLAFSRHATSKISNFNDIYQIFSFGFRGEALASIASVSEVECHSTASRINSLIKLRGGIQTDLESWPADQESGTTITIRNLFFNTPARLKFIKSRAAEKNKIQRIINSFIISNSHASFVIKLGEKEKTFFPSIASNEDNKKRIIQFLTVKKGSTEDDIFSSSFEYKSHRIRLYANKKSSKGNTNKKQFLFANNRYFIDKKLHHLISRKMTEVFWQPGEYSDYVLLIETNPELIDPNVHPSKTEIKFIHPEYIHSGVSAIIDRERALRKSEKNLNNNIQNKNLQAPNQIFDIENTYFLNQSEVSSSSSMSMFNDYILVKNPDGAISICQQKEMFVHYILEGFRKNDNETENISTLLIGITFDKAELPNLSLCHQAGILMEHFTEDTFILKDVPHFLNTFPTKIIKEIVELKLKKHLNNESLSALWTNNHHKFSWPLIQGMQQSTSSSPFIKSLSEKDLADFFN